VADPSSVPVPPEAICEVIVTGPDPEALAALARTLVDERLCACGQVIPAVRSIYRWEGAVCEETEARVALHTCAGLVDAIVARLAKLHPYEVPCVLALPVADGDRRYLEWVRAEVRRAR